MFLNLSFALSMGNYLKYECCITEQAAKLKKLGDTELRREIHGLLLWMRALK